MRIALVITFTVLAAAIGSGTTAAILSAQLPVHDGDRVWYVWTAYDKEDKVIYTTDIDVARAELAAGNSALNPDTENGPYYARKLIVNLSDRNESIPVRPSTYLLGHANGDIIKTPLMVNPFGHAKEYEIPTTFGPLQTTIRLNLTDLYNETNANDTIRSIGHRGALSPGATIPYGLLTARVIDQTEGFATVQVDLPDDTTVYSHKLGLNLTVSRASLDAAEVTLRVDASVGEILETAGCELPVQDLPPGRYQVVRVGGDNIVVQEFEAYKHQVHGRDLYFIMKITKIERTQPWDTIVKKGE